LGNKFGLPHAFRALEFPARDAILRPDFAMQHPAAALA